MRLCFPERSLLLPPLLLGMLAAGACTQVEVQETRVDLNTTACSLDTPNNGNWNGQGGGGQAPPQQTSNALMDTYMVQIFELNHPEASTVDDCNTCLATRANCFFEKSSCVCGDPIPVSTDRLPEMLKGVRIGLPPAYGSLYCMRVMAVQRTSESEDCGCDPSWEAPDKVRLCALSNPYAASSLPIHMDVQCTANSRKFSTCLGQAPAAN